MFELYKYKIKKIIANNTKNKLIVQTDIDFAGKTHDVWFFITIYGTIKDDIEKTKWVCDKIYVKNYNKLEEKHIELKNDTKKEIKNAFINKNNIGGK